MVDNKNYLMIKQQIKNLTVDEYECLKQLCHLAKNLTNQATYAIRQHYFETGKYLNYEKVYHELKNSENYTGLNSNMAEQILKEVDSNFKSFFALLNKT